MPVGWYFVPDHQKPVHCGFRWQWRWVLLGNGRWFAGLPVFRRQEAKQFDCLNGIRRTLLKKKKKEEKETSTKKRKKGTSTLYLAPNACPLLNQEEKKTLFFKIRRRRNRKQTQKTNSSLTGCDDGSRLSTMPINLFSHSGSSFARCFCSLSVDFAFPNLVSSVVPNPDAGSFAYCSFAKSIRLQSILKSLNRLETSK